MGKQSTGEGLRKESRLFLHGNYVSEVFSHFFLPTELRLDFVMRKHYLLFTGKEAEVRESEVTQRARINPCYHTGILSRAFPLAP